MKLWQTLAIAASTLVLYEAFRQRENGPQEVIVHYADDIDDGFEDDWWSPQLASKPKPEPQPEEFLDEQIDEIIVQQRIDWALDVLNSDVSDDIKERARAVLREVGGEDA